MFTEKFIGVPAAELAPQVAAVAATTERHFKPKERILRLLRNGKDGRINTWLLNAGCHSPYLAGVLVMEVQSAAGQRAERSERQ